MRLTRRQTRGNWNWRAAARRNLRDPRASRASQIRADRPGNLFALTNGGSGTARAAFRDIEVPVGAETHTSWVVKASRVLRDRRNWAFVFREADGQCGRLVGNRTSRDGAIAGPGCARDQHDDGWPRGTSSCRCHGPLQACGCVATVGARLHVQRAGRFATLRGAPFGERKDCRSTRHEVPRKPCH